MVVVWRGRRGSILEEFLFEKLLLMIAFLFSNKVLVEFLRLVDGFFVVVFEFLFYGKEFLVEEFIVVVFFVVDGLKMSLLFKV